jgi:hypothetical protein
MQMSARRSSGFGDPIRWQNRTPKLETLLFPERQHRPCLEITSGKRIALKDFSARRFIGVKEDALERASCAPIKRWRCHAKIIIFNKSEKCDQLESNLPPYDVPRKNYHSLIDQFTKSKKCNQLESNRPLCGPESKSPALYCSTAVRRIYFHERQFFGIHRARPD